MKHMHKLYVALVSLFAALFGRTPRGLAAPTTAPSQTRRTTRVATRKVLRRDELKELLGRIDGGGKHYGSKRRDSKHRGSGRGKRSGRA